MNGSPPDGIGAALALAFMERLAADPEWATDLARKMRPPGAVVGGFSPVRRAHAKQLCGTIPFEMRRGRGLDSPTSSVIQVVHSGVTRTNDS